MTLAFYVAAAIAVFATAKVITQKHPVHALLYFVVSLLAVALVFFTLGAHLVALLEVMIYAGAIMVLFIFVIMMLNMGSRAIDQETRYLSPGIWIGPAILSAILLVELIVVLVAGQGHVRGGDVISPQKVGIALFDVYFLGVELASMILLAALVGAYHLGKRDLPDEIKESNF